VSELALLKAALLEFQHERNELSKALASANQRIRELEAEVQGQSALAREARLGWSAAVRCIAQLEAREQRLQRPL
jgi:chromosome segregation ATPase